MSELIFETNNLRFYKYSPHRYYVYTVTGTPLGDIYLTNPYWVFEPSGMNIYPSQWLDDISDFIKQLTKENEHE